MFKVNLFATENRQLCVWRVGHAEYITMHELPENLEQMFPR